MILVVSSCAKTEYRSDVCLTTTYAPYDTHSTVELKAWVVNFNCDRMKLCEPEKYKGNVCETLETL